ncbi:class I adenylate-forming enzyme family protein [Paenibacillus filicis]|uniref:Class I adenylate-forming enzyme family protein n=1 Tax=Paenibacillus gyeongsangnamensis TaxID=3388067 RepID=A0ABT4Q8B6_9BACL|nr:class I adenylate-forming enzyme family protein [Paenibacillus filicis]MCZ8513129.1 class I adenylate-forming enzyme family protein [Paenibacillus filicis]
MKRVLNTEVLIIKGRSDSLIIIGGLKVNLMEIEMKLKNFSEINEALVIFNDKDQWIEAYISPKKEIELTTLLSWCKEHFAHYKIPKRFHLVEMIPKTATGKIKRVITEPISPIQTLST